MNYTDILAIVVSYNGTYKISKTIEALLNKVGHIHIVDNYSNIESLKILNHYTNESKISIEFLEFNSGIGYALNRGVLKARELGYSWILTMDQDSLVDDRMIDCFCEKINSTDNVVCLTPCMIVNGRSWRKTSGTVSYAITSGNLIKVAIFQDVGLYDEGLFIDCVDFDFSLRVRMAGFKIHQVPGSILKHELGDQDVGLNKASRYYVSHPPLRRYYIFRNQMYIFERYIVKFPIFVAKLTLANFVLLVMMMFFDKNPIRSLRFSLRGIDDYFKRKTGEYREV